MATCHNEILDPILTTYYSFEKKFLSLSSISSLNLFLFLYIFYISNTTFVLVPFHLSHVYKCAFTFYCIYKDRLCLSLNKTESVFLQYNCALPTTCGVDFSVLSMMHKQGMFLCQCRCPSEWCISIAQLYIYTRTRFMQIKIYNFVQTISQY